MYVGDRVTWPSYLIPLFIAPPLPENLIDVFIWSLQSLSHILRASVRVCARSCPIKLILRQFVKPQVSFKCIICCVPKLPPLTAALIINHVLLLGVMATVKVVYSL